MDMIAMARELGKTIQQDERYLALQIARQNSDNDETLQDMIGEFNLKRMAINNEAGKENRDESKLQELNAELRHVYAEIMKNPNMTAYNQAKEALDAVLKRVNAIISLSVEGEDPETADLTEDTCGGSCSSCAGCH
ncbi:MAG: YlbF family regulator [Clostridiales bacterium]|jgi:cell fate (sporulation/competence/biofilm development) regulator YlbF (YheA/YmcA/DUF963 family)|nr:YlbF family regulator [Clostridiales bacterium]